MIGGTVDGEFYDKRGCIFYFPKRSILIPPNVSPLSKRQNIYPTRDDETYVNDNEKKGEDSEVNVLHCSPQLPMDKLVVTSPHWRSGRIIALCKNDVL